MKDSASLDFLDGLMDKSVRLWLKPEYLTIINGNIEPWQKIFWLGLLLAEHRPDIDKLYAQNKDNRWLAAELASFCELIKDKEAEAYYVAHANLAIQVLSIGLWIGLITVKNIDGLDPILDTNLIKQEITVY